MLSWSVGHPVAHLPVTHPMPTPGSFRPRQGRLKGNSAGVTLPTLWYELSGPLNGPAPNYADHPLWLLPNTYPFLRLDVRTTVNDAGVITGYYTVPPEYIPPAQFATNLVNLVTAYQNAYGPLFRSVGKPMRYAILLIGPDAPDCAIKPTTHPLDFNDHRRQRPWCVLSEVRNPRSRSTMRRNRTTQGYSPKLGGDYQGPFFHHEGRRATRAWAASAFEAATAAIQTATLPIPGVPTFEFLLTDNETIGKNPAFGYPVALNDRDGATPFSTSWFQKLVRDYPLQPQHHDYIVGGNQTFGEWLAARQTTLAGSPLPTHSPNYFASHPKENDLNWLMMACAETNFAKTLSIGLYEPARAAFGPQLRCGNWTTFADGRVYASEARPRLFRYFKQGEFDLDVQVPANYSVDDHNFEETRPHGDPDPGWDRPGNWKSRLETPPSDDIDLLHKANIEKQAAVDRGAARSSRAPLFPSSSTSTLVLRGEYASRKALVVERLLRAVMEGARDIWMFEPAFNLTTTTDPPMPSDVRSAAYDHAQELIGRVNAMSVSRNRIPRAGHVSFSYLGTNPP